MRIKSVFMCGPLDGISRIENVPIIADMIEESYIRPTNGMSSYRPTDMYLPTGYIERFFYERVDFGDDPLEIDEESQRLPTVLYADPALPLSEIIRRLLNSFERVGGLTAAFGISSSSYPHYEPPSTSFRFIDDRWRPSVSPEVDESGDSNYAILNSIWIDVGIRCLLS